MKRLKLGGKRDTEATTSIKQRLDPETVADEKQLLGLAIPQSECEHPVKPFERAFQTQRFDGLQHYFGIGMPSPWGLCAS